MKIFFKKCWHLNSSCGTIWTVVNKNDRKVHWKVNNKPLKKPKAVVLYYQKRRYWKWVKKLEKRFIHFERDDIDTKNKRVWSWLRINAGGAHKTCKSNGLNWNVYILERLVADWWVTRKQPAYQRGTTVRNDC